MWLAQDFRAISHGRVHSGWNVAEEKFASLVPLWRKVCILVGGHIVS